MIPVALAFASAFHAMVKQPLLARLWVQIVTLLVLTAILAARPAKGLALDRATQTAGRFS
jgi:hypothetical protein